MGFVVLEDVAEVKAGSYDSSPTIRLMHSGSYIYMCVETSDFNLHFKDGKIENNCINAQFDLKKAKEILAAFQKAIDVASIMQYDWQEERTEFTLELVGVGRNKLETLKLIREVTGLSLQIASNLVDNLPQNIRENTSKALVEELRARFEKLGATVRIV